MEISSDKRHAKSLTAAEKRLCGPRMTHCGQSGKHANLSPLFSSDNQTGGLSPVEQDKFLYRSLFGEDRTAISTVLPVLRMIIVFFYGDRKVVVSRNSAETSRSDHTKEIGVGISAIWLPLHAGTNATRSGNFRRFEILAGALVMPFASKNYVCSTDELHTAHSNAMMKTSLYA